VDIVDPRFATYIAVAALLIATPGPDMALVTRNALSSGRRAANATAVGVAVGAIGWAIASTIGVGILLERSVIAFTILKLAGAAFLAFLGLRSLIGSVCKPKAGSPDATAPPPIPLDDRNAFRQGLIGNLLNPKAGVIFVSILPQFVRPGDSPLRLLLMLLAFEVMLLLWLNVFGYAVARAGRSRAGVGVRHALERITGVVLIGLSLRLAFERR